MIAVLFVWTGIRLTSRAPSSAAIRKAFRAGPLTRAGIPSPLKHFRIYSHR